MAGPMIRNKEPIRGDERRLQRNKLRESGICILASGTLVVRTCYCRGVDDGRRSWGVREPERSILPLLQIVLVL
jgi:hypothetical protein